DGKLPDRIEPAGQDIGDGIARFAAEKPGGENGMRALEEPRHGEWATRTQQHDHGLADIERRLRKRALTSGQAEIRTTAAFATHGGILTQTQDDHFRRAAALDGIRESAQILRARRDPRNAVDAAAG